MARIELVRSGGFAGRTLRAEVDTADPADPDAAWYAGALAGLDLVGLDLAGPDLAGGAASPAGTGPDRVPDRYRYVLTVEDDGGARHRLDLAEGQVPDELRLLVDRLVRRAGPPQA